MRETDDFGQFFKENYQRFYFYALRIINDEEQSRDIVSCAMESLWEKHMDDDVDNWFTYTVSFVRNKCIDHLRHKVVHRKYADFYKNVLEHHESMAYREEDERITAVKRVMETLPPRTKIVLQECFINHKKYKEVAEELDVTPGAVKKHIVKALRTIMEELIKNQKNK